MFALLKSLVHKLCQLAICLLHKNFPYQNPYLHGETTYRHHDRAFMMIPLHCIGAAGETAAARGFC